MQYTENNNGYTLRIKAGEECVSVLEQFAKQQDISGGFFFGLGACKHARVGMYHMDEYEYDFQTFDKQLEITNVTGNISRKEGEVVVHAHVTLADENQNAFGGHLKEAVINPTCEIQLVKTPTLQRTYDTESKLDLFNLSTSTNE